MTTTKIRSIRISLLITQPTYDEILKVATRRNDFVTKPNMSAAIRQLIWLGIQASQKEAACSPTH